MTSSNSQPEKQPDRKESAEKIGTKPPSTSATTNDLPEFGWSSYAERINGRFAMVGFVAVLLIEVISRETFLRWAGILH